MNFFLKEGGKTLLKKFIQMFLFLFLLAVQQTLAHTDTWKRAVYIPRNSAEIVSNGITIL
jgi:hypothetical protein